MPLDDVARYDIDLRLRQKEGEFQAAILLANGVRVEVLADDGVVVPGQAVKVSVLVSNNGATDLNIKQIKLSGFDGAAQCTLTAPPAGGGRGGRGAGRGGRGGRGSSGAADFGVEAGHGRSLRHGRQDSGRRPCQRAVLAPRRRSRALHVRRRCAVRAAVPADARSAPSWRSRSAAPSSPATSRRHISEEVVDDVPVEFRYEGNIFSGEKRSELLVVPAFSVRVSPDIAIVPVASLPVLPTVATPARSSDRASQRRPAASEREVRVTVINDGQGPAESVVRLVLPKGWSASPAQQSIKFARQDESLTVRFAIKPAVDTVPGAYHARAVVSSGTRTFDRGYQTIEYPHIRRQHIYHDADVSVKVINVKTAPNLRSATSSASATRCRRRSSSSASRSSS